ncbi:hypothetical protein Esti_000757 [Eimeria stiedai]
MAAAQEDLFNGGGGEFDMMPQDDFLMEALDQRPDDVQQKQHFVDLQQELDHHQQQQQDPFSPQQHERQLNNGLDALSLENNHHFGSNPGACLHGGEVVRPDDSVKQTEQQWQQSEQQRLQQQHLQQQHLQQQHQQQQEVEARQREEEELRRDQQQIAQEEIRNFYEQRSKHLQRRREQLKSQAAAAAAKEKTDSGSGWARVLWLVDSSSSSSAAAAAKEKGRAELSRLRKMLSELAAEETKG